jgi:hypothetical protein
LLQENKLIVAKTEMASCTTFIHYRLFGLVNIRINLTNKV